MISSMRNACFLLNILVLLLNPLNLLSQWTPSHGIEGAEIKGITIHCDSILFINTFNGIYGRNLADTVWEDKYFGSCTFFMSNGEYLFTGGAMIPLYRSENCGVSWSVIETIGSVFSMDNTDSVIFVCDGYYGTYRSNDHGNNWLKLGQGLDYMLCRIYAYDSVIIFNDLDIDTIWISYDMGDSFSGLTKQGVAHAGINSMFFGDNMMIMSHHDGVFLYNEKETMWIPFGDSLPTAPKVKEVFHYQDTLFCISEKGLYKLNPEESYWIADNEGLESLHMLSYYADSVRLMAGNKKGLYYKNEGNIWVSDYKGLRQRQVSQVLLKDSLLYALTQDGLYYSLDSGSTFNKFPSLNCPGGNQLIIADSVFYLSSYQGFAVSNDYGYSWSWKNEGFPENKAINSIALADTFLFCSSTNGLYRSSISTIFWESLLSDYCFKVVARDSIVILSLSQAPALRRSADFGITFSEVSLPGIGVPSQVFRLIESGEKVFILKEKPYYTSDWGLTWSYYPFTGQFANLSCISESDDIIIVGGNNFGFGQRLVLSNDEGFSWSSIVDNLPQVTSNVSIYLVYILKNRIIVHPQNNSLWYRDDVITGLEELHKHFNNSFMVYPNPFKDNININSLHYPDQNLLIQLYDITGRMVHTRYYMPVNGNIQINASGIKTGLYIIRLAGPVSSYNKKIIKY